MASAANEEFPVWGLLPKKETGAYAFLNKYPEYDGRGTVIAIFDTGVDPAAPGLQVTTDGKPKLIERYDCSGAGDVDTTTIVTPVNGEITGLTGRTLKIPESWKNVNEGFRIGVKRGFELYPKFLRDRIIKQRKEKLWDPYQKQAVAESNKHLSQVQAKECSDSKKQDPAQLLIKEEATARVDILNQFEKQYTDCGPTYDCVLFHNGKHWCACIDTSEKGDLASCKLLGEYSVTRDYTILSPEDQMTVSINVHDNGDVLELVSVCGSHGTHVAAIAAANFPDDPEKNGVAPGAQLVSLTIGDSRLDSLETGTAIIRSIIQLMRWCEKGLKIHVINMSYGEHAHWSNSGRVGELMSEAIDKYGIVFVAAAGNNGPALCTLGTPPDIATDNIIGVGAYVSPEMMAAEYSLRRVMPGTPYTWTSRAPTLDGGKGITVCAPGGAITSVPKCTLKGSQLMNGTSMASPNCAGCVAVILSGIIQKKLLYNPFQVKRALENTAQFLSDKDPFAQGSGLVQVEKAFDYLNNYQDVPERDVRFRVTCGANNAKGIILRYGILKDPVDYLVTVEPIFFNTDKIDPEKKLQFQISLNLVCDVPWISCSRHLEIMNCARPLSVRIDPSGLQPGVHNTRIRAYDCKNPERGPVFTVEVTVFQPITFPLGPTKQYLLESNNCDFKQHEIKRFFILTPDTATWAVMQLRGVDKDKSSKFMIHCVQTQPKKSCKVLEFHKMTQITADSDQQLPFKVQGGIVLEIAIAKFWSEEGNFSLNFSVQFFGARPNQSSITMHHADGIHSVMVQSNVREDIAPSVKLNHNVSVLRPTSAKVTPLLSDRDTIPEKRVIYQLMLNYSFHVHKGTKVVLINGLLSDALYESDFESQIWFIYDSNKQLVYTGGSYADRWVTKLEKGDYTVKHQIRHEKVDLLEKYVDLPLFCSQKLPNSISLDVYSSKSAATTGESKLTSAIIHGGKSPFNVYFAALPNDKLIKSITPGQFLSGNISFSKDETGKKVDVYPFKYILTEPVKKNNSKSGEKEKLKLDEFTEAKKDFITSWISKLDGLTDAETVFNEVINEYPDHLPAQLALLQKLEPDTASLNLSGNCTLSTISRVLKITELIMGKINQTELLAFLGMKHDLSGDAPSVKSQMEKNRNILVEAIGRRGVAMCRYYLEFEGKGTSDPEFESLGSACSLNNINDLWCFILKFVDASDPKGTHHFALWHAAVHKNYGRLLKLLVKLNDDKPNKTIEESMQWTADKAGWTHISNYLKTSLPSRYPNAFRIC
nr:PREDICTED: tripeptidyl-peptidase 2 [Bemisia tabaci]